LNMLANCLASPQSKRIFWRSSSPTQQKRWVLYRMRWKQYWLSLCDYCAIQCELGTFTQPWKRNGRDTAYCHSSEVSWFISFKIAVANKWSVFWPVGGKYQVDTKYSSPPKNSFIVCMQSDMVCNHKGSLSYFWLTVCNWWQIVDSLMLMHCSSCCFSFWKEQQIRSWAVTWQHFTVLTSQASSWHWQRGNLSCPTLVGLVFLSFYQTVKQDLVL
jgi:hypothetical protein